MLSVHFEIAQRPLQSADAEKKKINIKQQRNTENVTYFEISADLYGSICVHRSNFIPYARVVFRVRHVFFVNGHHMKTAREENAKTRKEDLERR